MKKLLSILSSVLVLAACGAEKSENPQYERQAIELPGVTNARQLGGYSIGGRKVREDVLLRSGSLANASDEAIRTLQDRYKLAMVVDFRTSMERGKAPDRDVEGARNVWMPILEKMLQGTEDTTMMALHLNKDNPVRILELLKQRPIQEGLSRSYDMIVFDKDYQRTYAAFLDSLVALPQGRAALWHCSQGKDRCGLGTAFVLAALGADRSLIVADFAMSNIPYSEDINQLLSLAEAESTAEELSEYIYLLRGVSAVSFEKTLDEIDARYGSLDNYLEQALDLTPAEKEILREKFLTDDASDYQE